MINKIIERGNIYFEIDGYIRYINDGSENLRYFNEKTRKFETYTFKELDIMFNNQPDEYKRIYRDSFKRS